MPHVAGRLLLALLGVVGAALATAERVQIPVTLERAFIESVLREQAFTGPGHSVRISDDGTGCQFLELREPVVRLSGGLLTLRTRASARVGRLVNARCLLLVNWRGALEFSQIPSVSADGRSMLLRTTGWRAYKPDGSVDRLSTTVGRWLDGYLPAGLKEIQISFVEPISQLDDFLSLTVGRDVSGRASMLLGGIVIDEVSAGSEAVTVTLGMDTTAVEAPPAAPEPVLSSSELARLSERLEAVDAFVTYTIKSMSRENDLLDGAVLLDVLVALRRDLMRILAEQRRQVRDPARALFVDAWEGLLPLLRLAVERRSDQAEVFRYLTFIGAGDALKALDNLGPAAGVEVSSDGLRRLARILIPNDPEDPLRRGDGVDVELRRASGFGPPVPPPQFEVETSWLDWFIASAVAASSLDPSVAKRLNNWVPTSKDVEEYLPLVRTVLRHVVSEQLGANSLEADFHQVYR
jgi:hypothetical protein